MSSWKYIADPEYEELSTITRSLHLSQAMDSYFKQRLFPHRIVSKTVDLNVKVLWFAPTRPMNENNMYGNVSFTLDWKTALEQLGPYLYFIDHHENSIFYYGRVLLTHKKYEFLTPVDDGGHGMPMQLFNNKYYAATASEGWQYVLEIGVEVTCRRQNWVYKNCNIEPNDHSAANTLLYKGGPYNPCICHQFNYFKSECPSPYKLEKTKMILEEECPTMLRNKAAGKPARSSVKKRTKKKVAAAAAARKPVVEVNDESYDDYYYEERYPISNSNAGYTRSTPKKEKEEEKVAVSAAAAAARKPVVVVNDQSYDDYYYKERYPISNSNAGYTRSTPKKEKEEEKVAVSAAAAAAAARKPVVVVNDQSYDGYYYKERYPISNSNAGYARSTPKKKEEEGLFTFDNVVTGVIMGVICWYFWRK